LELPFTKYIYSPLRVFLQLRTRFFWVRSFSFSSQCSPIGSPHSHSRESTGLLIAHRSSLILVHRVAHSHRCAHPQGCSSLIHRVAQLIFSAQNMSASHLLSLAGEHISHLQEHTTAAIQPHLSHIQHTSEQFFHAQMVNPMVGAVGAVGSNIGQHINGAVHGSQAVIQHLSGFCNHLPMVGGGPSPQQVNWALRGFVPPKHLRMENLSYPHVSNPCESTEERLRELGLPVALTRSPQTNNNNQQQDEHAAALLSSSPIQGLVPLATQAQAPAPSPPSLGDNNSSEFDFHNSKGQQTTLEQHLSAMSLSESGSTTVIAP